MHNCACLNKPSTRNIPSPLILLDHTPTNKLDHPFLVPINISLNFVNLNVSQMQLKDHINGYLNLDN